MGLVSSAINAAYWDVLKWLAGHLPATTGFPSQITDAITSVMNVGYTFSFAINWNVLFQVFTWSIELEATILLVKFTMWVIRVIRG